MLHFRNGFAAFALHTAYGCDLSSSYIATWGGLGHALINICSIFHVCMCIYMKYVGVVSCQ